ncbi:aminotransferase class I/II-fold pyridoxal phosphate-dependent enzyme [Saxibacter everestensis]|uniref:Aminotransferase class I/II-fold pyridoxal phosphate-dependent enzyme n=1 Tax=Saxibacter everestensis TaxID=2909229 RepID=A0ABY8R0X5_9MICO|nr:aminotransferase class I/II-fold pyridoxal phosphate-dependent enzyme [Brevibacteriaceae bacterium ZFBP1038]
MALTPGRWKRVAAAAGLVNDRGVLAPTIFAEMSALAGRTNSINLGQGAPDTDPPAEILQAAHAAIDAGINQYPPGQGNPELLRAVSAHQKRFYDLDVDPEAEVLVTTGATEGIAASILALASPGDEVVIFEPFYDEYPACIEMAGAVRRTVPLSTPDFSFDPEVLAAAFSEKTVAVIINNPHNPTGKVFTPAELQLIVDAANRAGAWIISDEVYEHLLFDGRIHTPVATLPGARNRTITISSAGKTFSVTGWKIGWLHAPAEARAAIQAIKQFLTYVSGAPFQPAVARALDFPQRIFDAERDSLSARRDLLTRVLRDDIGLEVYEPQAGYFVNADVGAVTSDDALTFCRALPELCGVVAVPVIALCTPGSAQYESMRTLVRFAFCKQVPVLEQAAARLQKLRVLAH